MQVKTISNKLPSLITGSNNTIRTSDFTLKTAKTSLSKSLVLTQIKKCANFKSFRFKIETESVRNKSRRRKTLSLSLVDSLHSRFSKPKELLFPKKQHLYKNFPELVWWRTLKNISKFVANFFLRR